MTVRYAGVVHIQRQHQQYPSVGELPQRTIHRFWSSHHPLPTRFKPDGRDGHDTVHRSLITLSCILQCAVLFLLQLQNDLLEFVNIRHFGDESPRRCIARRGGNRPTKGAITCCDRQIDPIRSISSIDGVRQNYPYSTCVSGKGAAEFCPFSDNLYMSEEARQRFARLFGRPLTNYPHSILWRASRTYVRVFTTAPRAQPPIGRVEPGKASNSRSSILVDGRSGWNVSPPHVHHKCRV